MVRTSAARPVRAGIPLVAAVDYRLPGGLSLAELSAVLHTLVHSGKAVGLEITVFDPALDPDGSNRPSVRAEHRQRRAL
jgi:arginase family enzyme